MAAVGRVKEAELELVTVFMGERLTRRACEDKEPKKLVASETSPLKLPLMINTSCAGPPGSSVDESKYSDDKDDDEVDGGGDKGIVGEVDDEGNGETSCIV